MLESFNFNTQSRGMWNSQQNELELEQMANMEKEDNTQMITMVHNVRNEKISILYS